MVNKDQYEALHMLDADDYANAIELASIVCRQLDLTLKDGAYIEGLLIKYTYDLLKRR